MVMAAATLADELKGLDLYDVEIDAINAWADAFATYFEDASTNGVPIAPLAIVPAKAAMVGALTGLSTDAATALQVGIVAFWGALVPAVAWPGVLAIVPPVLLSGMGVLLTGVFTANTEGELDKDASMTAIAGVIHTNNLGGIANWPPPPGGVGPQPIL